MSEYQFFSLLGTLIVILTGGIGWILRSIGSVDKRVSQLEIEVAVQKARLEERK